MLRKALVGVGAFFLGGGLALLIAGFYAPGAWCAIAGGLLVVGVAYERVIYKPIEQRKPGAGWEKTSERFVDDKTGKPVTVYIQPATGERMYVDE